MAHHAASRRPRYAHAVARARRRSRAARVRRILLGLAGVLVAGHALTGAGDHPAGAALPAPGYAVWARDGQSQPFAAPWTGSGFGPTSGGPAIGQWRIIQGAEAPSRDEILLVGVNTAGQITGTIFDGSSWSALPFNPLATVSESFWWGFDVAYETRSGDAVVVWNNGTSGSTGLSYRVWDGTVWSSAATITAPVAGEPQQMRLAADPTSDEMVLVVSTSAGHDYALVWDGSSWGNGIDLSGSGWGDLTDVFVAYEQQSGDALVVWGEQAASLRYRVWDGAWSAEQSLAPPGGVTGEVRWTTLGADPGSDRIALGVSTFSADVEIWLAVWDGAAWGSPVVATTASKADIYPGVAVAFEGSSGEALAVYGEDVSALRYRTWAGSWSAQQAGPDLGNLSNSMTLDPRPGSDQIMLSVQDSNRQVTFALWSGSGFGTPIVQVADSGEAKNQPFVFVWESPNRAPVFGQDLGDRSDTAGDLVAFGAPATDPDGDPLTYSAAGLPPGVGIDPATGDVAGTLDPGAHSGSPYSVTLRVEDPGGLFDTDTFTWTVVDGNGAPQVTSPGDQANAEGDPVALQVVGSDPDGDPATWSAAGLPPGLAIDPATGLIAGTIDYTAAAGSPYPVVVTLAEDAPLDKSGSASFTWTVADTSLPPAFDQDLGDRTDPEGAVVTLDAPASDPDGDPLTYSATGLPPGLLIYEDTGTITGVIGHTASAGSPYAVTLRVQDPSGGFDTDSFTWTVTDTPVPLDVEKTSDVAGRAQPGDTVWYTIEVTNSSSTVQTGVDVSDPVPAGASYVPGSLTVDVPASAFDSFDSGGYWGDEGNVPWSGPWVEMDGGPPDRGPDRVVTSTYCVAGLCFFIGGSGVDLDGHGIERAVDLTGHTSATLEFARVRRSGGGSVAVRVRGNGNPWTTVLTLSLTADDSAPVTEAIDISAYIGADTMVQFAGSGSDVDGDLYVDDVRIRVDGDGAAPGAPPLLATGFSLTPGDTALLRFAVTVDDPPASGTLANTVTVSSDQSGGGIVATVADPVNRYPAFSQDMGNRSDAEGDVISLPAPATDPDGDPLTWGAAGLPPGLSIDPATGVISGTIGYEAASSSPYAVTLTVADVDGLEDTDTFTWTVSNTNRGPSVTSPGDQTDAEGDAVSVQMEATDPDGDGFTWSATGLPPGLSIDPGTGLIGGTITFDAAPGSPYSVTVTATDDGIPTASGGALFTWTVTEVNQAPVAVNPGDRADGVGSVIVVEIPAADPDGDTLTWSVAGLPPGLSADPATGLITGTILSGAGSTYTVSFTVTDDGSPPLADSGTFAWVVTEAELTVAKTSDAPGRLQPGDVVGYTVTVTNSGSRVHTGVRVEDPVPPGSTFVPGSVTVAGGAAERYADRFRAVAYAGSDGPVDWSPWPWVEFDEATNPATGNIRVMQDGGRPGLALRIAAGSVGRQADLSGAGSVELRFGYRRERALQPSALAVEVSATGTAGPWTTVATIQGGDSDPAYLDYAVDVTGFAGPTTAIRFRKVGPGEANKYFWVDDVRLVTRPVTPGNPPEPAAFAELLPGEAMTITFQVTVDDPPASGTLVNTASASSDRQPSPTTASVLDTVNRYPVFTQDLGDRADAEGDVISLPAPATDPDGDPLTWGAAGLPDGLSIDPATGVISGTIGYEAAASSPYAVTLSVADVDGLGDSDTFTWTVHDTNRPPVVTDPGDQYGDEGDAVTLGITGSDPDGDGLTWSAAGLPPGLGIDAGSGVISGTITYEAAAASPYDVTVTATDDGTPSLGAQVSFRWVVANTNRPPDVVSPGDQANAEGDAVSLTVAGSDPDGNRITWSAAGLPDGLTIDPGTGVISGSVSYEAAAGSPYVTIVTATDDGAPHMASQVVFTWAVSDTNRPPDVADPGDQASGEGDPVTLAVVGSDPDGDTVTWTAAGLPGGLTIDPATGVVSGTVSYEAGAGSPHSVTVTATDDGSPVLASQVSFTWVISETNRAPVVTNPGDQASAEGDPVTLAVAGSDPDGHVLTWTAAGLPDGLSIDPATGIITGMVTFEASPGSPYPVTVRAEDDGAPVLGAQVSFTWTIADVNRAPVLADPGDQHNPEGMWLALPVPASDPDGDGLTWSAAGLPTGLSIDPASGLISGTIEYTAAAGSPYAVTVAVADDGTPSLEAQVSFTWTVDDVNLAPAVVSPGDQASDEGDTVNLAVHGSDPDGDTVTWSASGLPSGLSIDPAGGDITGTITYDASPGSPYAVVVTATDDGIPARATEIAFTWTVAEVNRAPVLTAPPGQWHDEDDTVTLAIAGTDPDGDGLTWAATGLPPGLGIDAGSGVISGTITFDAAAGSPYTVTVTLTDDGAPPLAAQASFTWRVDETNRAPSVNAPPDQGSAEGDTVSLAVTGSDPDGNGLSWSASGLPLGLAIDPGTGVISGTVSYDAAAGSPHTVTVTATDDGSPRLSGSASFTWTVANTNRAPQPQSPGNQTSAEGDVVSRAVSGSDPDGDDITWSASGLPEGLAIGSSTGVISGTVSYEAAAGSPHAVTVTATDDGAPRMSAAVTFTWTVTNTNRAPEVAQPPDRTSDEGDTVAAAFSGNDPDGDRLTWSASGLPSGLSIDPVSGTVSGTLGYESAGTYPVEVAASDGTDSTAVAFVWTVRDVNRRPEVAAVPDRADAEGDHVEVTLRGSDPDGDALTWSASGLPPGAVIDPATGVVSGTLSYDSAGVHAVRVTVTDDGQPPLAASVSFTWTVADTNRPPDVFDPGDRSDAEGDRVTFAIRASDPDGDRILWSAPGLPGGVSIDPATGIVSGVLSYDSAGTYVVTVTVTDDGSPARSSSVQFTWSVAERNRPPVLLPFGDRTGMLGDAADVTLQASDPDGDPVTWSITGLPTGLGHDGGRITGTLQEPGVFTVTVRVTDPYSASASGSFTWTVTVPPPPPDDPDPGWPVIGRLPNRSDLLGDRVALQPEASHPDGLALRFSAVGLPTGTSIEPEGGLVAGTLTSPGDYTVTIRVSDSGGRSAAATFLWTVNLPPNEAPTAVDDEVTIDIDHITDTVRIAPLGNDTDPEGRPLQILSVGRVPVGALSIDGDEILFTPPQGWTGRVSFVYTIVDDGGNQASALVTVVVRPPAAERAGAGLAVWDDAGTELRLSPEAAADLVLGSLFQSLSVLRMPLTLLGSAVLASLMLGGLLNLGFVLHRGIPMFARSNRRRMAVVLVAHGGRLDVLDEPGGDGRVVHRFVATEAGVIATGRHRTVGDALWLEVETPGGTGWAPQRHLTEHVDADSFAEDPDVLAAVGGFVAALRARGDLAPMVSQHGLWVAHHDTPVHYGPEAIPGIMDDPGLRTWRGRNVAYPDQRATFDVAVAGSVVEAWNHPRRELTANQPAVPSTVVPVEFTNLNWVTIGADLHGPARLDQTAWLVHFSFERGHPKVIALTKEG